MASTSSTSNHYEYDVFLSFRGEDTRNSFTDHLYKALRQAGIRTFRDDDEIHEGQELKAKIKRSIRKSSASIIVFSENFANSRWCLDELSLILRQKRKGCHVVLPVFYDVDPSDVRNQRGSFAIEAKVGAEGSKWTEDNVKQWKAALREAANLKGMVVSGYETDFIQNIVEKIYNELRLKLQTTPTGLTGIKTRAKVINSWLRYEQPGSPVLAICGMGGSGKTTLAKHIYYSNKHNFDGCSLLEDIAKQHDGLLGTQQQLLRDISGNNNMIISNVYEGALQLEKAIHINRVLIVVDDIDDKEKITTLFGTKVLNTQSKIIITTRLLNIDTWFGAISWRCHVHNIELLNCHESLELLSCHAFGSKIPMEGFEEYAVKLAQYCGGNPLALKVLGSSLSSTSQDQWTRNDMIEAWRSRMDSLNSLKGDIDHKIQDVLQKSFESLPCDSQKELFLHIACLFVGEYASHVERILENDYHAKSGMMTLINRCLLTISRNGLRLEMHKLLQDMARKIVRNESKDPAKHSRVWRHDESYRLLRKGDGSEAIEGLALDMLKFKGKRLEAFKTSSVVKMKNLKFLYMRGVKLTGSYENFPELRWLRWRGCNLDILPQGLLMNSLVAIDMSYADLEKFEPPMVLNSLKILDLSCSYKLGSIRNLHRLPKLVDLVLFDCTNLTYVCKTIEDLVNLSFLNFARCPKLLKDLFICGGVPKKALFSLPKSLSGWSLASNPFEMLPNYIDLKMLQHLNLNYCPNLKSLPCLPSTLKELNVDWCTSLERITFQSARFTLEKFDYEGCFKLYEIEGLFKLVSIAKLDEVDLGHMQWIKAYQDHKVDLVGDVITEGRTFNMQMLFEYGIKSTYLQGIKDERMLRHDYTSSSRFLSFRVPLHPKKNRIQGLDVTFLYRAPSEEDRDMLPPLAKISNKSKGITWVYNPVVFCEPGVDEDVVWLSYWPIGNILDVGDEVHVNIFLDKKVLIVRECGASLVYMGDGEVKKEEKCERIKRREVIGGDLSNFEVTKGGYYLCRIDFFQLRTRDVLKRLFGDNSLYTDSRRWRPSSQPISEVYQEVNAFRNPKHHKIEVELGVSFNSESETEKIVKAVSSLVGVESVSTHKEIGRLFVVGRIDPQAVAMCVREFENMVQVLAYTYYGNG